MSALLVWLAASPIDGSTITPAQREFFEKKIRPILVQDCYECHSGRSAVRGGLALDHRSALRAGGDSGPAVVPGDADASLLIQAVRHRHPTLKMPKDRARLEDSVIADFVEWINMGAPDPRDKPPSVDAMARDTSWEAVLTRRKQWWSFRPIESPSVPARPLGEGSDHEVDRFILARLTKAGLEPAPPADRRTLLRRVTFALTGLPPAPDSIARFLADDSPDAFEAVVDALLGSPQFGERWARHWMDWVRYAETHGSEGDAPIPEAWRYRDYLIRALNADVPYNRLVEEHLAGDLLDHPRIDPETGRNESALGIAHLRLVQHGYQPVDALDEQVKFIDDQINVVSKAFLGLTVSCARCHDHKFDAISQRDYYALYGVFVSARPAQITVESPERLARHRDALRQIRARLKHHLAAAWLDALKSLPEQLAGAPNPRTPKAGDGDDEASVWPRVVDRAANQRTHPLHAWTSLRHLNDDELPRGWRELEAWCEQEAAERESHHVAIASGSWDLTTADYAEWFRYGTGLPERPSPAGEFHVLPDGDRIISGLYPAGVYTHRLSSKHNGILTSPRFPIETDAISVRLLGGDYAQARLVVEGYPLPRGGIYGMKAQPNRDEMGWVTWDVTFWKGYRGYLELATFDDLTFVGGYDKRRKAPNLEDGRSYFGVSDVVLHDRAKGRPRERLVPLRALFGVAPPPSGRALAERYRTVLQKAVAAWRDDRLTNTQAAFLDAFVRNGLLPNSVEALPEVAGVVAAYRALERDIPVPRRAPGVIEAVGIDQPLFKRGDHTEPGEPVPRRFLEAIDARPYETRLSGRMELARSLIDPTNPFTARVLVNRIWHYVFGRGLVPTVDNFGRMGEPPSHPELLDFLAQRFTQHGWSIKEMVRYLVRSNTYQQSSRTSDRAREIDPDNRLLSHARIRRLDAEAIRDTLLAVSGRLDRRMFGPGVPANRDPKQARRRSVYITIRRNRLDAFLQAFDAPQPFSTRGRRAVTTVPAQSLTLMNDPLVIEQAKAWARSVLADGSSATPVAKVSRMFERALGRPATPMELEASLALLRDLRREGHTPWMTWSQLGHAIFELKEFMYLR